MANYCGVKIWLEGVNNKRVSLIGWVLNDLVGGRRGEIVNVDAPKGRCTLKWEFEDSYNCADPFFWRMIRKDVM